LIPNGWKLVPVEATEEMLKAGCPEMSLGDEKLYPDDLQLKWKAMLDAAPEIL
jgi:hypothetical protein